MSGDSPDEESGAHASSDDEPTRQVPTSGDLPETARADSYSQAYSAPESEHFVTGSYLSGESSLYDYDNYGGSPEETPQPTPPRWPWVVGVVAIIAAVALVVSVSVLVTRTETDNLATPETTTSPPPPIQDEITTTPPPPPPPPPTTEPPPPPPPETVTITEPPPEPEPAPEAPPPPTTTEAPPPPPTTTVPPGPRQVTYSITGSKAPGDVITITYTDASGRSRTQRNVYIPWSLTVTPISQSEVGSVRAVSLFLVSKLNCSITTSDGTVLSSQTNNAGFTNC